MGREGENAKDRQRMRECRLSAGRLARMRRILRKGCWLIRRWSTGQP